ILLSEEAPPFVDAWIAEAVELVVGQRSHPGNIEIVVLRHCDGAQRIDQAKPSEQLHAARVRDVHLGIARRRSVALHQHASDAASRQLARERHADGTAADDQHGHELHAAQRSKRCDQSILILAWRTTFDHFSVSACMWAVSSSELLKVGSNPMVAMRSLTSGSAIIRATCLFRTSIMSLGVPAGTNTPIQKATSWP